MSVKTGFNIVNSIEGYYIILSRNKLPYHQDGMIATILKITVEEYRKTLVEFNGDVLPNFHVGNDIFFQNKQDALKCCEFLNLKYGLMMKLINLP